MLDDDVDNYEQLYEYNLELLNASEEYQQTSSASVVRLWMEMDSSRPQVIYYLIRSICSSNQINLNNNILFSFYYFVYILKLSNNRFYFLLSDMIIENIFRILYCCPYLLAPSITESNIFKICIIK